MVLRRESVALLATQELRFRCMTAQDLGLANIPHRGHSNTTCMKGKRPKGSQQDLRFRCMAAQDLGLASIPHRGHSNTTCMKGKRPMGRSDGMGVGRHIGKFRPTRRYLRSKEGPVGEITWDLIVPKLWWRVLPVLSSVSPAWKKAIRTNRVYEEKVRANSTETLVIHVHVHSDSGRDVIALFSTSDNCCYELPPIPCLPRGILRSCQCIALGGKLYVLGGLENVGGERVLKGGRAVGDTTLTARGYVASEEVYVLDLAGGQWKWEQCANMLESRYAFGCGVIDDKIYVMGGTTEVSSKDVGRSFVTHLLRSEVYDTQENAWSPIMPMRQSMLHLEATIAAPVGKELVLYDGAAGTLGLYDPANDDWTVLERFGEENFQSAVFGAEGNLYSFSRGGIDVYDFEQNSWINRHIHSFAALLRPDDFAEFWPVSVFAVKDELHFTSQYIGSLARTGLLNHITAKGSIVRTKRWSGRKEIVHSE